MLTAHADHVGSLLRPPELLEARRAFAAGELDPPAFKAIEDRAVLDVIRLQEDAGLPVVTDGELRRESFQSELVAAVDGFEGVKIDAPHYPLLIDPTWRAFYEARGWPAERWLSYGVELDNAVIDAAPGVTFGFHLCRGNQDSRWLVSGGYEAIAAPVFGAVHAHRLLLEYDDERSGGFDPLKLVPADKQVVLGLVTTKGPRPETEDELEARVREAAALVDLERLGVGTQCGFATSVVGNALTVADEERKLRTIARTATRIWG